MAREVAQALEDGEPLLGADRGSRNRCGENPRATWCPCWRPRRLQGGRAAVSTHTRALQSQILDQDLPRLQALLEGRKAALLYGTAQLSVPAAAPVLCQPSGHPCAGDSMVCRRWPSACGCTKHGTVCARNWRGISCSKENRGPFSMPPICACPASATMVIAASGHRCFVQKARQTARESRPSGRQSQPAHARHAGRQHPPRGNQPLWWWHVATPVGLPEVVLDTHAMVSGSATGRVIDEIEELLGRVKGRPGALVRHSQLGRANRLQGLRRTEERPRRPPRSEPQEAMEVGYAAAALKILRHLVEKD